MIFKINYSLIAIYIHDGLSFDELFDENAVVEFDTNDYSNSLKQVQAKVIEFFNKVPYKVWFNSLQDDVFQAWYDDDGNLHNSFKCAYDIYKNCIECCDITIAQTIINAQDGIEYNVSIIEDCMFDQIEEQIINQNGTYKLSNMIIKYLLSLR